MESLNDALTLSLEDENTIATLSIAPGAPTSDDDFKLVSAFLKDKGVRLNEDSRTAIEVLLNASAAEPDGRHRMIVATGVRPRHGQDGYIMWSEACERLGADDEDAGPVSYVFVQEDDLIARQLEPTSGVDGRDVFGETIPAREGAPATFELDESVRPGKHGELFAARSGALFFEGGRVWISDALEMEGDLPEGFGVVEFEGDIEIGGDVSDGQTVRAEGALRVGGLVGAARCVSGGDAGFDGGVRGRNRASIMIGGDLRARYLEGALVVVGRHVAVDHEISDCEVRLGGRLQCKDGAVRGGSCAVGGALEVAELGSPSGGGTRVALGSLEEIDGFFPRLQKLENAINSASQKVQDDYETLKRNAPNPTGAVAEQLTELEFQLSNYSMLRSNLEKAGEKLEGVLSRCTDAAVTVHRTLHRDVTLSIGAFEISFPDPIQGPVRIALGADGRPVITDLDSETETALSERADVRQRGTSSEAA